MTLIGCWHITDNANWLKMERFDWLFQLKSDPPAQENDICQ